MFHFGFSYIGLLYLIMLFINGPGHNLQYSSPKEFAAVVKKVLTYRQSR